MEGSSHSNVINFIGIPVVTMETACKTHDVFITATGNKNVIMAEHMA
jgi:S-adenosylhomocysteine hydrolase